MKFFDREKEVAYLRDIRQKSQENARFTVITGRRRVGKTQLIQSAMPTVRRTTRTTTCSRSGRSRAAWRGMSSG